MRRGGGNPTSINMSRALATIRKIDSIVPIEGADFIELAIVGGWQCIIKKGAFVEGDKGVYFEIDSMLPLDERYSFLGKSTNDRTGEGYRIRTMKMRKQLSQGLMLPLHMFADVIKHLDHIDTDLTERLGVWLYEPKLRQGNTRSHMQQVGLWPKFLIKTDQERIQNKMHYFTTYQDEEWEATLKLDGSSITIWNYDKAPHLASGKYNKGWKNWLARKVEMVQQLFTTPATQGVCSRNINLRDIEGNAFWDVAKKYDVHKKIEGWNVAIQGELVGPRIQNNHEQVGENELYIFDIYLIDEHRLMSPQERSHFLWLIDTYQTLPHVPIIDTEFSLSDHTFDTLQEYVTRDGMNEGVKAEGVVFKSITHPELSFKCISNKYLLGEK